MRILYLRALSALLLFSGALLPFHGANAQTEEAGSEIEKESYFRPGIAPVSAPPNYDVTIVYFMDYQCPACRQYTPDVARVLAEDRKVRIIYRDTPIISDLSTVAARAAIASAFQGRHAAFHHALMTSTGRLSEAAIRAAADKAKVDWPRLQVDLKTRGEAIDDQIGRNVELAVTIGVLGTPAFIVGERQSNGALDYNGLKAEIADARAVAGTPVRPPVPATESPGAVADILHEKNIEGSEPEPKVVFRRSAPKRVATVIKPRSEDHPSSGKNVVVLWAILAALAASGGGWWWNRRRRERHTEHANP